MGEARRRFPPATIVALFALAAVAMSLSSLAARLPASLWLDTLTAPDTDDIRQMLVRYSFAPRLATSLMCGAALGLAGALLQMALRNPLASPTTLGISGRRQSGAGARDAVGTRRAGLWARMDGDGGRARCGARRARRCPGAGACRRSPWCWRAWW